jgi:hypothetical protein
MEKLAVPREGALLRKYSLAKRLATRSLRVATTSEYGSYATWMMGRGGIGIEQINNKNRKRALNVARQRESEFKIEVQ